MPDQSTTVAVIVTETNELFGDQMVGGFAATVTNGGVRSRTVTVKLPELLLPARSVAVHATVVVPIGNVEGDPGTHKRVTPPTASVVVGDG
jgi:hypothetical protein